MTKSSAVFIALLVAAMVAVPACRAPADFEMVSLEIVPPEVTAGETASVIAEVRNTGGSEGVYTAVLTVNGADVEAKEVTVAPGGSQKVTFSLVKDAPGTYQVGVGGLTSSLEVAERVNLLAKLSAIYPELYQELLKLPDLRETDDRDREAIEDIAQLALDVNNKLGFEFMLNEGIKDKRKYCTPLEALLWIAYDREFDIDIPLRYSRYYSLAKLIEDAWKSTTVSKNFASEKWLNFAEVTDRLNSPQLIAIYMQNNFTYSYTPGEAEGVKSAEQVFKDKKGACYDHALFAAYCLKKNGYDKAWGVTVIFDRIVRGYGGHVGCAYQDPKDSLYYCMDFGGGYRVYGPFTSIDEAAKTIYENGSRGEAGLSSYSVHDIDLKTGKYKTLWY